MSLKLNTQGSPKAMVSLSVQWPHPALLHSSSPSPLPLFTLGLHDLGPSLFLPLGLCISQFIPRSADLMVSPPNTPKQFRLSSASGQLRFLEPIAARILQTLQSVTHLLSPPAGELQKDRGGLSQICIPNAAHTAGFNHFH